jgi:PKD domain
MSRPRSHTARVARLAPSARRIAGVAAIAAAYALAVGATGAMAQPELKIESPADGGVINNANPTISGTTSDPWDMGLWQFDPVTVTLSGQAELVLPPALSGPEWSTAPLTALAPGTYTALAEQTDEEEESGTSEFVTFTVDTTPPAVTLNSPGNGATVTGSMLAAGGHAGTSPGDVPQVTAQLFAGAPGESTIPLESIASEVSGESWAATFAGLGPGTYTVRAVQADDAGNEGVSSSATVTVQAPRSPRPALPVAAFAWLPSTPHAGEQATLISESTDAGAPIRALEWSIGGGEHFSPGGPVLTTTFAAAGSYIVRLRVRDTAGDTSVASHTITVSSAGLPTMQPFPVVRIVGRLTGSGARITLLSVQAPSGALVTVTCRGSSCPARKFSHIAAASKRKKKKKKKQKQQQQETRRAGGGFLLTFPRLARSLHAGVVLEVRVTKAGQIGKYTRFLIRRGRVPLRSDRCLWSASSKPAECPA